MHHSLISESRSKANRTKTYEEQDASDRSVTGLHAFSLRQAINLEMDYGRQIII